MTRFDGPLSEKGYAFNKFGWSLTDADNRARYRVDPEGYIAQFGIRPEMLTLFAKRDWPGLLAEGASVYILAKLALMHGEDLMKMGADMRGMSVEALKAELADPDRAKPRGALH